MNYQKIISLENLYEAVKQTVRSKRTKTDIAEFLFHLEDNVDNIYNDLKTKKYKHGKYQFFKISDPKPRTISKATVKDRVIHHAVHDVIIPNIDKSFIFHSYACREGKGVHKAVKVVQRWTRSYDYYLHFDIVKYFNNINRNILKRLIKKVVDDKDVLWLLNEIIDSSIHYNYYIRNNIDLFTAEKGIPLGNLTSQLFANIYLNELDQFVKHKLRIKPYIRYMDDFIIMSKNKEYLRKWKKIIIKFVDEELNLKIHTERLHIRKAKQGITFLGFRIYPFYLKVKSKGISRFRKNIKNLKKKYDRNLITKTEAILSYNSSIAFINFANSSFNLDSP